MHDDELWQVFSQNGLALDGQGAFNEDFSAKGLVKGVSHVWLWRRTDGEKHILLQERSKLLKRFPGMYHISAAGHINVGESPVDAAVREAKEEIGLDINASNLYFVQTVRSNRELNALKHIYIYEILDEPEFNYDDGEVESVEWVSLKRFEEMAKLPDEHNLVEQGWDYFSALINAIELQ